MMAERVARFRDDLERLLGGPFESRIALAVSGGPDSMAMLALASAAFPGRVVAATVDHRLRPESTDEARMVAQACARLGVPHVTLTVSGAPEGNLHAWARGARYALLERWADEDGVAALLTAHHADDQAETFLMRANRASGLAGLAGVRAYVNGAVPIVRPLLGWRRAELREVVTRAGLPFVDDPSNADPRFDRARFRDWLAQAPWIDTVRIARSAAYLAEAAADLAALCDQLYVERRREGGEGEVRLDMTLLPRGVRRALVQRAIAQLSGTPPSESIEPLLDALDSGGGASQGGVQADARQEIWRFRAAPPRRSHRST